MPAPKDPVKYRLWKEKMSRSLSGKPAWNKGLSVQTNTGRTHFKPGQIPWNKGLKGIYSHSEGTRQKMCEAHEGFKHTEKSKEKMRGRIVTEETRIMLRESLSGRELSEKTKEKISESMKNKGLGETRQGENSPNWKGGRTALQQLVRNSFKYRLWRSDVFTRDDFTCQKCGRRGGRLHAHHEEAFADIMEFNDIKTYEQAMDCEELWNINNGSTYCKKCHQTLKKDVLNGC